MTTPQELCERLRDRSGRANITPTMDAAAAQIERDQERIAAMEAALRRIVFTHGRLARRSSLAEVMKDEARAILPTAEENP